eukprot:TRINITY_DN22205_c0_g1_i1.p1 TRINITY_DN22205_c0_g1~~TRINITY_DN22205_c0_g1_i1.p1  ORF type:complete len:534 (+),score=73.41 TRINITY_DN22205_c0_g1_i1:108-1709(+)
MGMITNKGIARSSGWSPKNQFIRGLLLASCAVSVVVCLWMQWSFSQHAAELAAIRPPDCRFDVGFPPAWQGAPASEVLPHHDAGPLGTSAGNLIYVFGKAGFFSSMRMFFLGVHWAWAENRSLLVDTSEFRYTGLGRRRRNGLTAYFNTTDPATGVELLPEVSFPPSHLKKQCPLLFRPTHACGDGRVRSACPEGVVVKDVVVIARKSAAFLRIRTAHPAAGRPSLAGLSQHPADPLADAEAQAGDLFFRRLQPAVTAGIRDLLLHMRLYHVAPEHVAQNMRLAGSQGSPPAGGDAADRAAAPLPLCGAWAGSAAFPFAVPYVGHAGGDATPGVEPLTAPSRVTKAGIQIPYVAVHHRTGDKEKEGVFASENATVTAALSAAATVQSCDVFVFGNQFADVSGVARALACRRCVSEGGEGRLRAWTLPPTGLEWDYDRFVRVPRSPSGSPSSRSPGEGKGKGDDAYSPFAAESSSDLVDPVFLSTTHLLADAMVAIGADAFVGDLGSNVARFIYAMRPARSLHVPLGGSTYTWL